MRSLASVGRTANYLILGFVKLKRLVKIYRNAKKTIRQNLSEKCPKRKFFCKIRRQSAYLLCNAVGATNALGGNLYGRFCLGTGAALNVDFPPTT